MSKARIAVSAIFFINGFLYANWIARLPLFQDIYEVDNAGLGIVLLCHAVGALLAMPLSGYLIVKNGSRKISIGAVFLFCTMIPFIGIMPNAYAVGIWFMLMGGAAGLLDVSMNAQAVLVEQNSGKPIMSSFHAMFSAGMMIGAGVSALFTLWEISFSSHLLIISVWGLALSAWCSRNLIIDDIDTSSATQSAGFQWPERSLWGIGFIAFCCMLGEGAVADWSSIYMQDIVLAAPAVAPLGLAAFSVTMMIGRFLGDWVRMKIGDRTLLIYSSISATVGLAILLFWIVVPVAIFGFLVVGLGLATIIPIAYSRAGNAKGLAPGLGISMVTTIGYSGFLFGPPIIGFLADWKTLRIALLMVLILFIIMSILSLQVKKETERIV